MFIPRPRQSRIFDFNEAQDLAQISVSIESLIDGICDCDGIDADLDNLTNQPCDVLKTPLALLEVQNSSPAHIPGFKCRVTSPQITSQTRYSPTDQRSLALLYFLKRPVQFRQVTSSDIFDK
jgi:hypothetical protein